MSENDEKLTECFAERLCDLMQENKTDVGCLSRNLNLNTSAVYKWLRKVSLPNFENAIVLSDGFGCSLDYLFGLKELDVQYTPHSPLSSFSEHFEKILCEKKITEYRLVRQTGISRSKIASWRKGESLPSIPSLVSVATALDLTLDALVGRD